MGTCLFCDMVAGDIPCEVIYDDELCLAFRDIAPQAPTHILLIPKMHLASLNELPEENNSLAGHLLNRASHIAALENLAEPGYRVVINCGQDGGQTVSHLHLHILGGRSLQWPPG